MTLARNMSCVRQKKIQWTSISDVPHNKKVTYRRIVCDIKSDKAETHQTWLTVGKKHPHFFRKTRHVHFKRHNNKDFSVVSLAHQVWVVQLLILNFLSKQFAWWSQIYEASAFHHSTRNLTSLVYVNGWAYMKIIKGMYVLKQAGIITHCKLIKHLDPCRYHPVPFTPGLCKHDTKPTMFTLVVDNFVIKYLDISDAEHLFSALREKYMITTDMECKKYIGMTLVWNYINKHITLSMPN